MKPAKLHIFLITIAAVCMLASCSTTKRLPEGEILYTGLKAVNFADTMARVPAELRSEIRDAVAVKPNNPLLGSASYRVPFPLGLWVYNNWPNPPSGLKHKIYEWLVTEPILVSDVRPEVRVEMINQILDNNGFFRGTASYELAQKKNKRKASIIYNVDPGPAYNLDSIILLPETTPINRMIDSLARANRYLKVGSRFSTDSLSAARTRITNDLRNQGYYYFRPEYIDYLADSTINPGSIALKLTIPDNVPSWALDKFTTGKITTIIYRNQGGGTPDTIHSPKGDVIKMMPMHLRDNLIPSCIAFREGRVFRVNQMERTQSNLARLGIFNSIDMQVQPDTTSSANRILNVIMTCTLDKPLEASVEANVSSKSNSYLGPGVTLGLTNHNMFGGGEQFNISLTGSYEWQTGHNSSSVFNSYEVGLQSSLAFPRLLAPTFIHRRRRTVNWTKIGLGADLLNRPHYFKMAQFNASLSYDWQPSKYITTSYTPIKITYTKLITTTPVFDSIMDANRAIAFSFRNQFIPQMSYNFVYDRAMNRNNTINVSFSLTEAGNIFWALYEMCGDRAKEKTLFRTPFSQFVKGQAQIVYGRQMYPSHWIVSRFAIGAAHAYGNSSQVPYSEQFYVGGANSIRAFTVRSIGPGSYRVPRDQIDGYFDQTGTFKLEANVEYRFPILGPLHGAVFLDAGNVWLLKEDPQRPGGTLRGKTFWNDIATGTGVGLRFDISMLVIRGDLGIGIHAPYDTGKRGYYNMTSFGRSLAFHLAIGYPF